MWSIDKFGLFFLKKLIQYKKHKLVILKWDRFSLLILSLSLSLVYFDRCILDRNAVAAAFVHFRFISAYRIEEPIKQHAFNEKYTERWPKCNVYRLLGKNCKVSDGPFDFNTEYRVARLGPRKIEIDFTERRKNSTPFQLYV